MQSIIKESPRVVFIDLALGDTFTAKDGNAYIKTRLYKTIGVIK